MEVDLRRIFFLARDKMDNVAETGRDVYKLSPIN